MTRLTMRCEPGHRIAVAIERPRGPGSLSLSRSAISATIDKALAWQLGRQSCWATIVSTFTAGLCKAPLLSPSHFGLLSPRFRKVRFIRQQVLCWARFILSCSVSLALRSRLIAGGWPSTLTQRIKKMIQILRSNQQQTEPWHSGCNRRGPRARSLSLGR
jgi:hypothetical protein